MPKPEFSAHERDVMRRAARRIWNHGCRLDRALDASGKPIGKGGGDGD